MGRHNGVAARRSWLQVDKSSLLSQFWVSLRCDLNAVKVISAGVIEKSSRNAKKKNLSIFFISSTLRVFCGAYVITHWIWKIQLNKCVPVRKLFPIVFVLECNSIKNQISVPAFGVNSNSVTPLCPFHVINFPPKTIQSLIFLN